MARRLLAAAGAGSLLLLAACGGDGEADRDVEVDAGGPAATAATAAPRDLDIAVSEPREDSYYPDVGDPGVDALHYDLTLTWDPDARRLTGDELLTFRATGSAAEFRLDLGEPLRVEELTVDGEPAAYEEVGKDLVVAHPVQADQRYEVAISYTGVPQPVDAPSQRSDFDDLGWTTTDTGETWTMQEPFGAYTWYAVNDQPADKALYDFTLTVPEPWTGVANGELLDVSDGGGMRTTTWHLAEPASSYLVTTAFGDYDLTRDESASGVPITYWTPRSMPDTLTKLQVTTEAMAWLEELLGPYPFDTFGTVVVDSESGMETQTMVTLGDTRYTLSPAVIVHELAHHWYGNQVSPDDWRDVWMNEGMAMYLQGMWEAEQEGIPVADKMREWATFERSYRAEAGPPAAYLPDAFGSSNVYYGPALMYHELREMLGDERFFAMVRAWPAANDNGSAGRQEYWSFMEEHTGEELSAFFDAWLLGEQTPPRG